jgi:hypothetical protein
VLSLGLPCPPRKHGWGIFIGYPQAALMVVNRLRSSLASKPA